MAERVTVKHVRKAFVAYAETVNYYGLKRSGAVLELTEGGGGYAYRIHESSGNGNRERPLIGDGFLGMTAGEAEMALLERDVAARDLMRAIKRGEVPIPTNV